MTVFLDTSSLFKLYFQEEGSAEIDALQLASAVTARPEVTLYRTADRQLNDLFKAERPPV